MFRPPYDVREWFRQMVRLGVNSIPVVFLTAMFTGMVLALQTFTVLQRFNAANGDETVVIAVALLDGAHEGIDGGAELFRGGAGFREQGIVALNRQQRRSGKTRRPS